MKLYEVVFTDTREPEGDGDAVFLVRADDFRSAVDEVLNNGSSGRHHCSILPHTIFEIGEELYTPTNYPQLRRVLRGPYYECAFNYGWREWRRKDLEPERSELHIKNMRKYVWEEVVREA